MQDQWEKLNAAASSLRQGEHPIPPFHWEIEFPEVFARENGGFDAIVGNPPFLGGKRISNQLGERYRDWLRAIHVGANNNTDLVGQFFRRAFNLLRDEGTFGLIATNTICQGDTRNGGLTVILQQGGTILKAVRRVPWPGEAAVIVSIVHIVKGLATVSMLDNRAVSRISAYLVEGDLDAPPRILTANLKRAFIGSVVLGMGFTFDDENLEKGFSSPISVMKTIIESNPQNAERVFPYIGGEEVTNHPQHLPHRFVIDLGEISEDVGWANWPDLMKILSERVRPERNKLKNNTDGRRYKATWWQHARRGTALYLSLANLNHVYACNCGASPHLAFARLPTGYVYANTLVVIALQQTAGLCAVQSRCHEIWARFFASSMKDDLRYTASDCFETYPFPPSFEVSPTLEVTGGPMSIIAPLSWLPVMKE